MTDFLFVVLMFFLCCYALFWVGSFYSLWLGLILGVGLPVLAIVSLFLLARRNEKKAFHPQSSDAAHDDHGDKHAS